jgi:hypothetical protein
MTVCCPVKVDNKSFGGVPLRNRVLGIKYLLSQTIEPNFFTSTKKGTDPEYVFPSAPTQLWSLWYPATHKLVVTREGSRERASIFGKVFAIEPPQEFAASLTPVNASNALMPQQCVLVLLTN